MMNNLFQIPDRLPDVPDRVPMFRATQYRSFSSRDNAYQTALTKRTRSAARLFKIKSEPQDEGERLVFRHGSQTLQIYRASDSLWWANHDLANRDSVDQQLKLPSESEATEIAKRELDHLKLDAQDANISSVTFVEASIAKQDEKPQTFQTAVDVNYTFSLAELPVFGPGAKIKVSLTDGGRLAQIIYFWRRPRRAAAMPTISLAEALERFQRDPAFFRLRNSDATVEIHSVQFGYYAMSPGDFQRFYVPVYAIDATVRTREFPRYDFRRYVVAVRIPPDAAKVMDAIANPATCRIF